MKRWSSNPEWVLACAADLGLQGGTACCGGKGPVLTGTFSGNANGTPIKRQRGNTKGQDRYGFQVLELS